MSVPAKLAGFAVILAVVFAASFAVGRTVGPIGEPSTPSHHTTAPHAADQHVGTDGR